MGARHTQLIAKDITQLALCAALLFILKMAMIWLPNVHFGVLLIIVYTLTFRHRVLYIIYTYVLLEIFVFGFDPMWSVGYLYIWTLLAGLVWLFRGMKQPLGWAVLAGGFGLFFGALMAPPFLLITIGPANFLKAFLPYWVAGIPFDLVHAAGNFAICLFLFNPLLRIMKKYSTVQGEIL